MPQDPPPDSAGPSSPPPLLPEGWLAQWEGVSRQWYFVQRATGHSQWNIPTEPVILTPSTTPTSTGTGPSRAPPSRPSTNSPRAGGWSGATPADGTYSATDRAGFSSLFGAHGNSQQGGLTQMAMGMLGRLSNQNKPAGHHSQLGAMGQHLFGQNTHQQNPFGYSSNAQPGVYAGVAPQYHPAGQHDMGPAAFSHAGASSLNVTTGISSQPGIAQSQQFGASPQGNLSSQFTQTFPQNQAQQAVHSTPAVSTVPVSTGLASSQGMMGQIGSNPSPGQPQWQSSQQPPVPMGTKPTTTQPGMGSTTPAIPDMQTPGNYGPSAVESQNQSQQNLAQQAFGSRPSSQNPGQPAPNPSLQSSQYPVTPGQSGVNETSSLQTGAGSSFQTHSPQPHQGTSDGAQGYSIAQPVPQQSTYNTNSHPNYSLSQAHGPGVFTTNGQNIGTGTVPATSFNNQAAMGPYDMAALAAYPHNTVANPSNAAWSTQYLSYGAGTSSQLHGGPVNSGCNASMGQAGPNPYQHSPGAQMNQFGGNVHHGAAQHYQAYHPQSNPSPGSLAQWGQPGPVPQRSAMSDPQFVSGPWASNTPPTYGMMQPSQYGGNVGWGDR